MKPPVSLSRLSVCSFCSHRIYSSSRAIRSLPRRPIPNASRPLSTALSLRAAPSSPSHQDPKSLPASAYPKEVQSFRTVESLVKGIAFSDRVPTEEETLKTLRTCREHALYRLAQQDGRPATAASAVLSLDNETSSAAPAASKPAPVRKLNATPAVANPGEFADVSNLAFRVMSSETTFLTPKILEEYLHLQTTIRDASPIPAVFALYANKPVRGKGKPNPDSPKNAIPVNLASAALDLAIESRDINAALDIIDTSVATPAFRRAKAIRKLIAPGMALAGAPVALYVVADRLAEYQTEVDHGLATNYAFAGLLAYAGFTVSIGMVALLSANDQMVRTTWVQGTPLRQRWIREEERRALDLVAMAWGFKEKERRGFEEGEEWELLREVVERKGMMLDDPALMEGME